MSVFDFFVVRVCGCYAIFTCGVVSCVFLLISLRKIKDSESVAVFWCSSMRLLRNFYGCYGNV